ncbi:hypothetical protein [Rhizobium sp. GCM10022189]|uniref:hypothetical protein n=1 Tax=Rhizobium sp. GCM10022189 TaxID=3252654 RepID=UPI00361D700B
MFRSLSKTALVVLAVLTALPAAAGERNADHRFPRHRGFNDGVFLGRHTHWENGLHFTRNHVVRYRPRTPFLKQFNYPGVSRYGRGNIVVIASPSANYDRNTPGNGLYAGSSYAYQTDGGTYVGGDGYYRAAAPVRELVPRAKVIDVGIADDPCSYEANVCVIRP